MIILTIFLTQPLHSSNILCCPDIMCIHALVYFIKCGNSRYSMFVQLSVNSCELTCWRDDCVFALFPSHFLSKAIVYEGQDKNPEMCRVLLTHEIMCR